MCNSAVSHSPDAHTPQALFSRGRSDLPTGSRTVVLASWCAGEHYFYFYSRSPRFSPTANGTSPFANEISCISHDISFSSAEMRGWRFAKQHNDNRALSSGSALLTSKCQRAVAAAACERGKFLYRRSRTTAVPLFTANPGRERARSAFFRTSVPTVEVKAARKLTERVERGRQ